MPGYSEIAATYRKNNAASTSGVNKEVTVEFLSADPTLTAGEPRIWVNTTTGTLKFSHDGTTVRTVSAT